uniref:Uncharacterized protein n=2 Tax=Candidatus Kentrum sp. FM TaxID=2126340 RepID=A0A450WSR6_9GAMM|nr:MAG: hypothetical protein BECKFM1743A_GA0114220_104403 [Candidatus Kentron sp. FM]VFK20106.1 MAG: hypothetical protein BECKFM1743B_GA0114221_106712 [Candidatus Kentron sp. FM]
MTNTINKIMAGIGQITTITRIILGVLCFWLFSATFMPILFDQKDINTEMDVAQIDALKKLSGQIKLLNDKISQLAKVTDESNTLKEKVDELKQEIVLIKHEQTKSRDALISIDTNISYLSSKIEELSE